MSIPPFEQGLGNSFGSYGNHHPQGFNGQQVNYGQGQYQPTVEDYARMANQQSQYTKKEAEESEPYQFDENNLQDVTPKPLELEDKSWK